MAKSKKQDDSASKGAAKSKPAARKAGKSASQPAGSRPAPTPPLIDTSLAAEAAARMVMNRASAPAAPQQTTSEPGPPAERRETSTFKQLKQNMAKPASQGLGGILGNAPTGKKPNQPFGGGKQVGRNQTFGADANRFGVPRRTGG